MALTDWAHAAGDAALLCYYEAFQLDAYAEMERVRDFLGVPKTPGRACDSASAKASSEDLRRLDAYPALRRLLLEPPYSGGSCRPTPAPPAVVRGVGVIRSDGPGEGS